MMMMMIMITKVCRLPNQDTGQRVQCLA